MSCRVLKRQVEEETINEMVRRAISLGCSRIHGVYLPTKKNGMVQDLYARMGFSLLVDLPERREFELETAGYVTAETQITVVRETAEEFV
jgi:predicted enzyme involved in methoxymalonyl-ACP biosynthesis